MARNKLNVLLVGGNRQDWWRLAEYLEQQECHCWFAQTAEDVRDLLLQHQFRLILSARPVTEGSKLMELVRSPERMVFYSFKVESGCLWFRALPEGISVKRTFTFRPNEFIHMLNEAVASLRGGYHPFPAYDAERSRAGFGAERRWAASAHV